MEEENKYSDGKIYKLVAPGTLDCYIGATCSSLTKRLYYHAYASSHRENQTQCSSYMLYDLYENISIQLVEEYSCNSKAELEARERYWIENTPTSINKNIPGRGWKERWEANRESNLAKHKEWLAANKEHLAAYRAANKDKIRDQERARNAAGYSEVRNAKKKEKATCDICQKEMNKNSLWTHKKTVHAPTS